MRNRLSNPFSGWGEVPFQFSSSLLPGLAMARSQKGRRHASKARKYSFKNKEKEITYSKDLVLILQRFIYYYVARKILKWTRGWPSDPRLLKGRAQWAGLWPKYLVEVCLPGAGLKSYLCRIAPFCRIAPIKSAKSAKFLHYDLWFLISLRAHIFLTVNAMNFNCDINEAVLVCR